MTMPHLMNCEHSEDGWCLDCVHSLWEEGHCHAGKPPNEGNPTEPGMYVAYVDPDIPIPFAQKMFLMWIDGKWGYCCSSEYYRGNVYGWVGPLPAMKLTNLTQEDNKMNTPDVTKPITEPTISRDAIHIPIMAVDLPQSRSVYRPGEWLKLIDNQWFCCSEFDSDRIGMVSPFLEQPVYGGKVWMFLPPGSITDLKHVWTHPKINPTQKG